MTRTLLLWIPMLVTLLKPSVSIVPELEGVKNYELVRPIRLHSVQRRDVESSRPETMKYAMKVDGKDIEMHLEKNRELLGEDYSETYYRTDDTPVTTTPTDIDHCYYHGKIVNDSESTASISTCDGLRGYFKTAAQRYLIEPLSGEDTGDHAVMKYDDQSNKPMTCGVTNTSWGDDFEPPTSRSRSRFGGPSVFQKQKYVELVLVADNREYKKWQQDEAELRKRIFEILNFVNMVYKPLNTFIALVGLEVWSNRDQISVVAPAGATLDAFNNWRNSDLVKRKKHDNAQLISGIDFEGSTVGLAFIATLCSGHSSGIIQDHNNNAIAIGATLAHEMGHNLGMNHDDSSGCACSGDTCIMAAALSYDIPRSFSSCSSANYEKFLTSRTPECLLDKPDYKEVVSPPRCGNGFLERGEECDCGTVEECNDRCCNATTCMLTAGSQCSVGECCEDCKILSASRECRKKDDDCDLAEYCNGKDATCPENVFTVNGLSCDGGKGHCYNGQCPQRPEQCMRMYGLAAIEASPQKCYSANTRGTYYAYCRRTPDTYIPCQQQDVMCGKLMCSNGNENPNYGRMVKFGECKAAFFGDYSSTGDRGQVDTGSKCGEGKVCSNNECVDLQTAYRNINCSAKCPGHGVCNHKNQCQCEPGWVSPTCDTEDGNQSMIRNSIIGGVVALLLLGAIGTAAGILLKRRKGPVLPTVRTKQHVVDNPGFNQKPRPVISHSTAAANNLHKPKGAPPPPPPAGNRPKPPVQNYTAARQALRPVPPPKV